MGKDNVVFHSVIWPSILLGASGRPAGRPGQYGELELPGEVVSSEFLTMEGRKFSSSRSVVIYVRDVLERYGADALRYYLAAAGPETSDTDFTWDQFVTRNNTELVAGWGNLVNRTLSMVEKNVGSIPGPGELLGPDVQALEASKAAFAPIGALLERSQQKAALAETMKVVAEANKYLSDQAPWKLKDDPARRETVLHTALQLVDDAKTLLTPFLPDSSEQVHRMLGGEQPWSGQPELREVEDLDGGPGYPVLMGDYDTAAVWASRPLRVGLPGGQAGAAVRQARAVRRGRGAGEARGARVSRRTRNGPPDETPPPGAGAAARRRCSTRTATSTSWATASARPGRGRGLDVRGEHVVGQIEAARAVGVPVLVQVGVDLPSSRWSTELAARPRGRARRGGAAPQRGRDGRGHRRGAARGRGAGRPAAGRGGGGDGPGPLPHRGGAGPPPAGGVVPGAHRDRQAHAAARS